MTKWLEQHPVLLWSLAGLFFLPIWLTENLWPLVFIGLFFLIFAVVNAASYREVFWGSLAVGWLSSAGSLFWFFSVYPMRWIDFAPGLTHVSLLLVYWFLILLSFGLGLAVAMLGWRWLLKRNYHCLFLFPLAWLGSELLGGLFFSTLFYGPGGSLNPHFSFNYSGFVISHLEFFYPIVFYTGVYGLSLLLAFVSVLGYQVIVSAPAIKRKAAAGLGVLVMVMLLANQLVFPSPTEPGGLRVIAIDTDFTSNLLKQTHGHNIKRQSVFQSVVTATTYQPDFILLPEDSRLTWAFHSPPAALNWLLSNTHHPSVIVDTSRYPDGRGNSVVRAFYYDLKNQGVHMFDKQQFVPFGEYIPWLVAAPLKLTGYSSLLSDLQSDYNYRPGQLTISPTWPGHLPKLIFCFESVYPVSLKERGQSFGSLIFHPVSHSWFNDTRQVNRQLDAMLRVQAIWNQVDVVSAGNKTRGKVYRQNGTIEYGKTLLTTPHWQLIEYNI